MPAHYLILLSLLKPLLALALLLQAFTTLAGTIPKNYADEGFGTCYQAISTGLCYDQDSAGAGTDSNKTIVMLGSPSITIEPSHNAPYNYIQPSTRIYNPCGKSLYREQLRFTNEPNSTYPLITGAYLRYERQVAGKEETCIESLSEDDITFTTPDIPGYGDSINEEDFRLGPLTTRYLIQYSHQDVVDVLERTIRVIDTQPPQFTIPPTGFININDLPTLENLKISDNYYPNYHSLSTRVIFKDVSGELLYNTNNTYGVNANAFLSADSSVCLPESCVWSVDDPSKIPPKSASVTYIIADAAGNATSFTSIVALDSQPPSVDIIGSSMKEVGAAGIISNDQLEVNDNANSKLDSIIITISTYNADGTEIGISQEAEYVRVGNVFTMNDYVVPDNTALIKYTATDFSENKSIGVTRDISITCQKTYSATHTYVSIMIGVVCDDNGTLSDSMNLDIIVNSIAKIVSPIPGLPALSISGISGTISLINSGHITGVGDAIWIEKDIDIEEYGTIYGGGGLSAGTSEVITSDMDVVVPPGATKVNIKAVGGGASGRWIGTSYCGGQGAGGGAGAGINSQLSVNEGETVTITVGAGGTGGHSGTHRNGSSTSINGGGISLTLGGGSGQSGGTASGTNASLATTGGTGSNNNEGGTSVFGSGTGAYCGNSTAPTPSNEGAGGSGAGDWPSSRVGAGADGLVILEWTADVIGCAIFNTTTNSCQ